MKPDVAASLLGSLPPPITAGIINELPPEKAQAVIKAMWNLTGTVEIDAEQVGTAEGTVLQYRPKDDPDDTPPAAPVRG